MPTFILNFVSMPSGFAYLSCLAIDYLAAYDTNQKVTEAEIHFYSVNKYSYSTAHEAQEISTARGKGFVIHACWLGMEARNDLGWMCGNIAKIVLNIFTEILQK